MSRQTEALLTVSSRTSGPWGDRVWRCALTAQLVVGGSAAYWLVTPTQPANHSVSPAEIIIEVPDDDGMVDAIVMLLSVHLGGEDVEGNLLETHNVSVEDGVRMIAPYWELAPEVGIYLAETMAADVRLGVVMLEQPVMVTEGVLSQLRGMGFDLDVFVLSESGASAS